jgi:hypothetical protein
MALKAAHFDFPALQLRKSQRRQQRHVKQERSKNRKLPKSKIAVVQHKFVSRNGDSHTISFCVRQSRHNKQSRAKRKETGRMYRPPVEMTWWDEELGTFRTDHVYTSYRRERGGWLKQFSKMCAEEQLKGVGQQ